MESTQDTGEGHSFLELKMHLLLSYCVNLLFYLLLKVEGQPVQGHPVIEELVRLRTYMEKIDPIDQKLRYQIDRLLKVANANTLKGALPARPNLDDLSSPYVQEDEKGGNDIADDEDDDVNGGVYRAPKTMFVSYDESKQAREEKVSELRESRNKRKKDMQELTEQLTDAPRMVDHSGRPAGSARLAQLDRQKRDYEEERFVRLSATREHKQLKKRQRYMYSLRSEFEGVGDFGDLSRYDASTGIDSLKNASVGRGARKSRGRSLAELSGDQDIPLAGEGNSRGKRRARKHSKRRGGGRRR